MFRQELQVLLRPRSNESEMLGGEERPGTIFQEHNGYHRICDYIQHKTGFLNVDVPLRYARLLFPCPINACDNYLEVQTCDLRASGFFEKMI